MAHSKHSADEVQRPIIPKAPPSDGLDEAAVTSGLVTHEDIAQRAYELYERRGRRDGHELEDWLDAERELLEEFQAKHKG